MFRLPLIAVTYIPNQVNSLIRLELMNVGPYQIQTSDGATAPNLTPFLSTYDSIIGFNIT